MKKKINTVCVVDDDDIYQFVVSIDIKKTNLVDNIIQFTDGELALNYIVLHKDNVQNLPDIIFLDLNMPRMDGWQFLEEFIILKAFFPKTIIIYMVSSSLDQRDIYKASKISELSGYLVKPINKDKLSQLFLNILS